MLGPLANLGDGVEQAFKEGADDNIRRWILAPTHIY